VDTKAEFRTHLKVRRDALPADTREAWSLAISGQVKHLCQERGFTRIGAFWPFGSEVDLRPAMSAHPDRLWFFPRVTSTHPPRLAWGPGPLEKGQWGLMEPVLTQPFLPPVHLLLVPGLAFDDEGHRLGYGRGFYDALLAQLPEGVLTVGVGFEAQMHLTLPVEPHDWPVQALLSELGLHLLRTEG
jgi:5-formyltetrahydrofolate cyclo-ligase